jgi:hypothetical protein
VSEVHSDIATALKLNRATCLKAPDRECHRKSCALIRETELERVDFDSVIVSASSSLDGQASSVARSYH